MDTSAEFKRMLEKAIENHPKEFSSFDPSKNVQDQLQGMLKDKPTYQTPGGQIIGINYFLNKMGWSLGSMEQLWLAFVMFQNFSKKWDGEEWQTVPK